MREIADGRQDGFERYTASLIVVSGRGAGEEHVVERPQLAGGAGPGVDAAFDDPEMSQRHLRIEFSRGRFHAIDLDSTNGTRVNGTGIASAELAHGDRIQAGAPRVPDPDRAAAMRARGRAGQREATSLRIQ